MALEGVVRGSKKPPRVILYGPPGVGKSTFGADSERPIFVPTEDGVDNLPVDQFPKADSWKQVLSNIRQVADGEHDYKTVVTDTLNSLVDLSNRHVCETMFGGQWKAVKGKEGFLSFMQGYKASSEESRKATAALDACRARGMTVILLAHVGVQTVKHPTEGEYTKFVADMYKDIWAMYSAWADIILRADYQFSVLPSKTGGKGMAQSTQTRIMSPLGSAACDAKCRVGYELPDQMNLSYGEFQSELGKNSDTLEQCKALWGIMTAEEQKKAMSFLGVSKLEDAPLTKCRQLLNRLRQKQAEQAPEEAEVSKGDK